MQKIIAASGLSRKDVMAGIADKKIKKIHVVKKKWEGQPALLFIPTSVNNFTKQLTKLKKLMQKMKAGSSFHVFTPKELGSRNLVDLVDDAEPFAYLLFDKVDDEGNIQEPESSVSVEVQKGDPTKAVRPRGRNAVKDMLDAAKNYLNKEVGLRVREVTSGGVVHFKGRGEFPDVFWGPTGRLEMMNEKGVSYTPADPAPTLEGVVRTLRERGQRPVDTKGKLKPGAVQALRDMMLKEINVDAFKNESYSDSSMRGLLDLTFNVREIRGGVVFDATMSWRRKSGKEAWARNKLIIDKMKAWFDLWQTAFAKKMTIKIQWPTPGQLLEMKYDELEQEVSFQFKATLKK